MATKAKKTTRKKSTDLVGDLTSRKDPKGGAQKKEGATMDGSRRGRNAQRAGRTRLL